MTANAPIKFTITDGPSFDRVIDAMKYAYSDDFPMHIVFRGRFDHEPTRDVRLRVVIYSVGHSGVDNKGKLLISGWILTGGGDFEEGFYDAQRREGILEITP